MLTQVQVLLLRLELLVEGSFESLAKPLEMFVEGADVRKDAFRSMSWGVRNGICRSLADRMVRFVTDTDDDRCLRRTDRSNKHLLGKGKQIR